MENFEQVLEQYNPMITSVMRKAHIYKNHEHFRQCATIALWQAWTNYNPEQGPFSPYAYRTMLTTLYKEMQKDNRYTEHQIAYDTDKISGLAEHYQLKNQIREDFPHLDQLLEQLSDTERQLLIDLYVHELTYEELAACYQVNSTTLKKRRMRLMKKLREMISRH